MSLNTFIIYDHTETLLENVINVITIKRNIRNKKSKHTAHAAIHDSHTVYLITAKADMIFAEDYIKTFFGDTQKYVVEIIENNLNRGKNIETRKEI